MELKEGDIVQSARLFIFMDGKLRWITSGEIFQKMGLDWNKKRIYLDDNEIEKLRGKDIRKWPQEENPEQRNISILWMGDEKWTEEYGGTHIISFHEPARPSWYTGHKVKLISYLKMDSFDDDTLKARVEEQKDHLNNGGWWTIRGHEPDAQPTWPDKWQADQKRRIEEYQMIREIDKDPWNHPVVSVMDMTGHFNNYPGWDYAFTGEDHDVFLIDCYARNDDGTLDLKGIEAGARLVEIGLSRSKGQFIPCIAAYRYAHTELPPVVEQFEWWNEHFGPLKACAFWSSGVGQGQVIGVYEDEKIAERVKQVNHVLGLI